MSKENNGSLDQKWLKKLPEGFLETAEGSSTDELKKKLLDSEALLSGTEKEMENDAKLASLKEDVKLLSSGYKEVLVLEKAKIKAIVYVLQNRGVV